MRWGNAPFGGRVRRERRRFTLLEVLAAVAMFAVVVAALLSATFGALRVRERTEARMEALFPLAELARVLKRDLAGAVPPGGVLAEDFIGTADGAAAARMDMLEFTSCVGVAGGSGESDLVRIEYTAEEAETGDGYDLVRRAIPSSGTLGESAEEVEGEVIARGVTRVEFSYYDGDSDTWLESWDSSQSDGALPTLVSVRVEFAAGTDGSTLAPLTVQAMPGAQPLPTSEATASGSGSAAGGGGGGA